GEQDVLVAAGADGDEHRGAPREIVDQPAERDLLDPRAQVRDEGAGREEPVVARAQHAERAAEDEHAADLITPPDAASNHAPRRAWRASRVRYGSDARRSARRVASAMMVICGFTLHDAGKTLASPTQRPGVPWTRPYESVTAARGSSPMRAVPWGWKAIISNSAAARSARCRARASSIERRTGREWTPG